MYVQISPELLCIRNVKTGQSICEVPELALSEGPKPQVLGVGAQARLAAQGRAAKVVNPFAHPRSLISDFTASELLLKSFVRRMAGKRGISMAAPLIVMHPLGDPQGGFTQVENRAFRELGLGAGASDVILWHGRKLSDEEAGSRRFLAGGVAYAY